MVPEGTLDGAVRIAIDIDSTLHHYWDQFADAVERRFGVRLPYEQQTDWGVTVLPQEKLHEAVLETHEDVNVLAAEPYPGAVEAVARWHAQGHFIHITSHRAESCQTATETWLNRIGLPFDELYCSYDKISRCVEIGIDVLIDDSPVNLHRARKEGITPATILHPWNRELCETEDIVCAEDWFGLAKALEPVLRGTPAT